MWRPVPAGIRIQIGGLMWSGWRSVTSLTARLPQTCQLLRDVANLAAVSVAELERRTLVCQMFADTCSMKCRTRRDQMAGSVSRDVAVSAAPRRCGLTWCSPSSGGPAPPPYHSATAGNTHQYQITLQLHEMQNTTNDDDDGCISRCTSSLLDDRSFVLNGHWSPCSHVEGRLKSLIGALRNEDGCLRSKDTRDHASGMKHEKKPLTDWRLQYTNDI